MTEVRETSFLASLLKKISDAKRVASQTGINTDALQKEAERQVYQIKDDPIKGTGITKSGEE